MTDRPHLHVFGHRPASDRLAVRALDAMGALLGCVDELAMPAAIGAAMFLGLGLAVYEVGDVVGQPEHATLAQVLDTHHTPAYMSTTYITDDKGNMTPMTIYVPESFEALIKIPERSDPATVEVSEQTYNALLESAHNGAVYEASFREGKWSHRVRMVDLDEPLREATPRRRPGKLW